MTVVDAAGWVALVATTIAATMTAVNLGARVTGSGFVVFTIGSLSWITVAVTQGGQPQLLYSNIFLTAVNLLGIWRWLGRQARYEEGGRTATERSAAARVPTLFPSGGLIGAPLLGHDGAVLGRVVEAMMRCDGAALAYLVVSEGGMGGVGERLHALAPDTVRFAAAEIRSDLTPDALAALPVLDADSWPAAL